MIPVLDVAYMRLGHCRSKDQIPPHTKGECGHEDSSQTIGGDLSAEIACQTINGVPKAVVRTRHDRARWAQTRTWE